MNLTNYTFTSARGQAAEAPKKKIFKAPFISRHCTQRITLLRAAFSPQCAQRSRAKHAHKAPQQTTRRRFHRGVSVQSMGKPK